MKNKIEEFKTEVSERVTGYQADNEFTSNSMQWLETSFEKKYSYNFRAFGRPIIQYPQDMIAMQELIWNIKPDLIIETGIAHGGSLIWYAGLLEINAVCGGPENAKILGIDIDIREHNKAEIEAHPLSKRIEMIQGSSVASDIVKAVNEKSSGFENVMVVLDSNHTHQHVLDELNAYADLVSQGNYCVVFDTLVENLSDSLFGDRPWGKGDNPMSAVKEFLKDHQEFEIDTSIDAKLQISVAPNGYLKRVK